jgi:hypothetical protein
MMPDFIQERWQTPVSDAQSLAMVSLLDHNGLHITLEDLQDPARRRFKFVFRRVAAYRNILEEYRMSEPVLPHGAGWTVTVPNSPWLAGLRAEEPLLDVHSAGCRHYVIVTEDDVIDILCPEPPEIMEVASAKADEDPPGKSQILYHSYVEEQIVEDITKRKPDI